MSLDALAVLNHMDAGNIGGALPKVRLFPIVRRTRGRDKQNIRSHAPLAMRHYRGEFPNARPRARTVRMRQHDQGCVILRKLNAAGGGPLPRRFTSDPRSVLVTPKYPKADAHD